MKRLIEILLISILLFSLAFFAGCKDEAEAKEHIEGQIVNLDKLYIFNGYDYVPIKSDKPKPYKPKETYTAEELDEIYKDEPALGILAKRMWGVEPPPEPNEPEEGSIIVENDKGDYVFIKPKSNQFGIPTWPDYIELDKDLIYFVPDDNDEWTIGDGVEVILIHKGTRIYFKEDE